MKKLYAYVFIFSMLMSSVIAVDANIYESGDFNKNPEQMVVLAERDLIRVNWEGKEHQIHVRKVYYPEKQKVDLTAFIEGSEVPYYTTITPKTSLQLDFDRDNVYDLKISIFNFLEEGGKKFVALKLEKLDTAPAVTSQVIREDKPAGEHFFISKYTIYYLFSVMLICLIIWKRKIIVKTYMKLKNKP